MKHKIKYLFILLLNIIALISNLSRASETSKPLTIEYFVQHSAVRDVKISPDGSYLAVILKKNGKDVLAVLDAATKKTIHAFPVRGKRRGVGDFSWVSNERIVYEVSQSVAWNETVSLTGELWGVNVDGGQYRMLLGYKAAEGLTGSNIPKKKADIGSHEIIDTLEGDDKHILIAFYPWKDFGSYWAWNSNALVTVYKLNVVTGKKRKVMILPLRNSDAITDINGQVRIVTNIDDNDERVILYKKTVDSEWEDFSFTDFEGKRLLPHRFSSDNKGIYFSANVGEGTRALYLYNLKDGNFDKIYHNKAVDMSRFVYDFSERKIVVVGSELKLPEYHYLDIKDPLAKIHKKLQKAFSGQDVVITSATKDGEKLIAYVHSDNNPGDYYLFKTEKMSADYVFSGKPWIDPEMMATTELLDFTTRDGVKIHGYLTKPKNSLKEGLPVIVMPHGGPHGIRDSWFFDWEVQLLANKGYAVLQVNFRGSRGFGKQFEEVGHGKWGTLMQDDLTDATRALIDRKVADPERICIYGASYGGYAALMGTVREPELYQCAIGALGVYNLPMMFTDGAIADRKSGLAYLKKAVGNDEEDMKRRSPVFNVDKIKADIFLIHGAQDERVPIEHAESLMKAFDKIGKSYEWLELGDEAHGYYAINNRILMYKKILAFFDKNIGSDSVTKH